MCHIHRNKYSRSGRHNPNTMFDQSQVSTLWNSVLPASPHCWTRMVWMRPLTKMSCWYIYHHPMVNWQRLTTSAMVMTVSLTRWDPRESCWCVTAPGFLRRKTPMGLIINDQFKMNVNISLGYIEDFNRDHFLCKTERKMQWQWWFDDNTRLLYRGLLQICSLVCWPQSTAWGHLWGWFVSSQLHTLGGLQRLLFREMERMGE